METRGADAAGYVELRPNPEVLAELGLDEGRDLSQRPDAADAFERLARTRIEEEVGDDALASQLVLALLGLASEIGQQLESEVHRPAGLSLAGYRIAFAVWAVGPLEPRRIAQLLGVSRASVSSALNTLERDGIVERQRRSADRRLVTVVLTDAGEHELREACRRQHAYDQVLAEGLSDGERGLLLELLGRLRRSVRAAHAPVEPVAHPAQRP